MFGGWLISRGCIDGGDVSFFFSYTSSFSSTIAAWTVVEASFNGTLHSSMFSQDGKGKEDL